MTTTDVALIAPNLYAVFLRTLLVSILIHQLSFFLVLLRELAKAKPSNVNTVFDFISILSTSFCYGESVTYCTFCSDFHSSVLLFLGTSCVDESESDNEAQTFT